MRILYLNLDRGIPVLGDKGASVHVREFLTAAAGLGHEVVLIAATLGDGNPPPPGRLVELTCDPAPEALAAECTALGLDAGDLERAILRREVARLAYDRTLPQRVSAKLAEIGFVPDLVYERHALFHQAGVAIAVACGVPRLLEVNAPLVEEQARFRGLWLEAAARATEAASYRGADAVIAVSDAVATHVRASGGHPATVHVVPNGVALGRYDDPAGGAAIRARLGLGGAPVIGFVGSFKPWHGMGFLLDVFTELAARRPDVRLLAVGEGPERAALVDRVAALGLGDRVWLPGRVAHAEVPAWLAAMDFTVAPYLPQPEFYFSPLKLFESFAAARPAVAPRVGRLDGLIVPGETGYLYSPGDPSGCLAALEALLEDPVRCRAMGLAARRRVAASGWDQTVARILALAPRRAAKDTVACTLSGDKGVPIAGLPATGAHEFAT
jgi:glycosyltransferase involved in cell wall biosynthesis